MIDLDRLEEILNEASPAPWLYRPIQFDDWGTVRTAPIETGDYCGHFVANARAGRFVSEEEMGEHRDAATDPYGPNALAIVELRNSAHDMIAELRELRAFKDTFDLPEDIVAAVLAIGNVEWGTTHENDADGHAAHVRESVITTAKTFGQGRLQKMHGLYVSGTETVLCHTGTSPNSPIHARALTGAWNFMVLVAKSVRDMKAAS